MSVIVLNTQCFHGNNILTGKFFFQIWNCLFLLIKLSCSYFYIYRAFHRCFSAFFFTLESFWQSSEVL